jgi:hypothetical protein
MLLQEEIDRSSEASEMLKSINVAKVQAAKR